jgi:spore maturation protein CgeB
MRIVMFYHSILSDWNHGNAHFLRGVTTELMARGHNVRVYEQRDAWSVVNLATEYGADALDLPRSMYPEFRVTRYDAANLDLNAALSGADLVLVHEWNDAALVASIGRHRKYRGEYVLLFHDTHHRAITDLAGMAKYDLYDYDGVLAYGASLRDTYIRRGLCENVSVWHEAADTRIFRPTPATHKNKQDFEGDLVWIGNWGDDERVSEIREFFIEPVKTLNLKARVYGVRYPAGAIAALQSAGIEYGGWLPNYRVPEIFSRFRSTVHIPRRPYVRDLPGIPTIRPFEALACGIPLVSAPWNDVEGLFSPGRDYLVARNGFEMTQHLRSILEDSQLADQLSTHGLQTIQRRHTCAHRVNELLAICKTAQTVTSGALR